MKKTTLLALATSAALSSAVFAGGHYDSPNSSAEGQFRPFAGLNYNYAKLDQTTGSNPGFSGINLDAGIKYDRGMDNPTVGMAWGFTHYFKDNSTKAENYYFDVRGYWPIYNFNLIGSVGANLLDFGTDGSNSSANLNLRLGVGADYYFTPNWGVQAMFHYTPAHNTGVGYNHLWSISTGIYYLFS